MARAEFTGFVKKIDVGSDCKITLTIFDPDNVLPELLPLRSSRVWIEMETAAPDPDEVYEKNQSDAGKGKDLPGQSTLDFSKAPPITTDETGFQVPTLALAEGGGQEPPTDDQGATAPETVLIGYACTQCGAQVAELTGSCAECGCSMFDELRAIIEPSGETTSAMPDPLWITCYSCGGSGADRNDPVAEGETPARCPACDGRGKVRNLTTDTAERGEAPTPQEPLCPECQGEWGRQCPICGGEGVLKASAGDDKGSVGGI